MNEFSKGKRFGFRWPKGSLDAYTVFVESELTDTPCKCGEKSFVVVLNLKGSFTTENLCEKCAREKLEEPVISAVEIRMNLNRERREKDKLNGKP
ncbi:MAG: hypothetical protein M0R37_14135 [Bacteroidales bacterium]|jgi:hypothetical protein|nr:hypothetical protein [Bacteroidales bacterium]